MTRCNQMACLWTFILNPERPRVEVVRRDGAVAVGTIDWTEDNREIRAARRRLECRRDRRETSPIASGTLPAARRELQSGSGSLVVIERIRASALRRLDGHDTNKRRRKRD